MNTCRQKYIHGLSLSYAYAQTHAYTTCTHGAHNTNTHARTPDVYMSTQRNTLAKIHVDMRYTGTSVCATVLVKCALLQTRYIHSTHIRVYTKHTKHTSTQIRRTYKCKHILTYTRCAHKTCMRACANAHARTHTHKHTHTHTRTYTHTPTHTTNVYAY